MTAIELLREEVEHLERQSAELDAAALRLTEVTKARKLDLLRAEGQGDSLEGQWIVAWLAGRHDDARRICLLMYPESKPTPLRLVKATPFDAEAAADAAAVMEFGSPAMAHDLGCVMGDEPAPLIDMSDPANDCADDEARASHGC